MTNTNQKHWPIFEGKNLEINSWKILFFYLQITKVRENIRLTQKKTRRRFSLDDEIYERISNSSICFIDQSPVHQIDFVEQTSLLKLKLTEHEHILQSLKEQINQVDQQLFLIQEDSKEFNRDIHQSSSTRQSLKRRHTFNSLFDLNCLLIDKEKDLSSSSSLYALRLLWSILFSSCFCDITFSFVLYTSHSSMYSSI